VRIWIIAVTLVACQSSKEQPPASDRAEPKSGYASDIGKICDVEKLSGADAEETTARSIIAAEWLGRNIETDEARDFLARVARVGAADKARLLRDEAARVGAEACPTALAWERLEAPGEPAAPGESAQ
jgi:hypothetical protein